MKNIKSSEISSIQDKEYGKSKFYFWLILMLVSAGIVYMVFYFYLNQKKSLTLETQSNISAIADLKIAQIDTWRKDRLGEAEILSNSRFLANEIRAYHNNSSDVSIKKNITDLFNAILQQKNYKKIRLVDENGYEILSEPENSAPLEEYSIHGVWEAKNTKKIFQSDFHFNEETKNIHIDIIIPLIINNDSPVKEFIILEINPYENFYPMIQTWPTASKTAESLLIEKRGDSVLYLNELRHKKNTAMQFSVNISEENILAVKAVKGVTGIVEGVDYRQEPVLGVIKPVPGTGWFLIAKIDKNELYSQINKVTIFTIVLVGLLLIIAVNIILHYWDHQKASHYKKLLVSELKSKALKEHFEYIVQYANDIMFLTNKNGLIIEANDRAVSSYGYSIDELLTLNIRDMRPPELREQVDKIFEEMHSVKDQGILYETFHKKKDGTIFPVEISSREVSIEGHTFYQGIIRDITDRKKAEEKIFGLNRIYSVLSQINEAIVWLKDRENLFDRVCEIAINYGKFKLAWIGLLDEKTHKVIPVTSSVQHKDYLDNINITDLDEPEGRGPTGRAIREEKYVICNDIKNYQAMLPWREKALKNDFLASAAFPLKCGGKIIGTLNLYADRVNFFNEEELPLLEEIMLDISFALDNFEKENQRKIAADALSVSEKKFKTVFENANDAIILIDEKKFIDFNLKAEELFNLNRNELLYKSPTEVSPLKQKDGSLSEEKCFALMKEAYENKPQRFEWLYKKSDGTLFDADVSLNSIQLGSKIMLLAVVRDETEKRKAQEELEEAKKKAEDMNRLKSSFLANMSHELRTPMTGILGFSEILNSELTDPDFKEMAGIILKGGKRLMHTLNSILDLSRIEADKMDLVQKTINLSEIVKESVKLFEAAAKEKILVLSSDVEADVFAYLDDRITEQILSNLIQNAVVYTERGGIKVKVYTDKVDGTDYAFIKVIDTGIGIPENYLGAIFEPFRQVSDGLGRKYEGTGLGLTITKKFVELMDGEIRVDSKFGKGSTFTVRFKAISKPKDMTGGIQSGNNSFVKSTGYSGKKVLLVEDEEDNIMTIQILLKNICSVDLARNGEEAIEMSKKNKYSVILMDIGLRGMSGTEASQEIKKIPDYENTPIVAVTAYAMVGDKEKFLSEGCTHYISKPFAIDEFKELVSSLL